MNELKQEILQKSEAKFLKIAMIISRVVFSESEFKDEDAVHREIIEMCDDGLLECQGNILKMRRGEIRLMPDAAAPKA